MVLRLFFATVALLAVWLLFAGVLCQFWGEDVFRNGVVAIPLPFLGWVVLRHICPEATLCQRRGRKR